jgi:4-amino-4-deoxy-L-arabinose transferase-like glycosyltransferase
MAAKKWCWPARKDGLECVDILKDYVKPDPACQSRPSIKKATKMRDRPRSLFFQALIVAAGAVIFFTNLGGAALWDMDEALYATCAREMFQRGDWVVPMFNGQMFPEKPPLMFWSMMAGFEVFGVNELGARLFSAVLGIGAALMAFHLGRLLFNARIGLWAGLATV